MRAAISRRRLLKGVGGLASGGLVLYAREESGGAQTDDNRPRALALIGDRYHNADYIRTSQGSNRKCAHCSTEKTASVFRNRVPVSDTVAFRSIKIAALRWADASVQPTIFWTRAPSRSQPRCYAGWPALARFAAPVTKQ